MCCSWFTETVKFFSPFVLVQLISCVLILATSIFQFDLVKYEEKLTILFAAKNSFWFHFFFQGTSDPNWLYSSHTIHYFVNGNNGLIFILLFWKIGHRKHGKYERLCVWIELAWINTQFAKIHYNYDYEYAKTALLSWIWGRHTEFKYISSCTYTSI